MLVLDLSWVSSVIRRPTENNMRTQPTASKCSGASSPKPLRVLIPGGPRGVRIRGWAVGGHMPLEANTSRRERLEDGHHFMDHSRAHSRGFGQTDSAGRRPGRVHRDHPYRNGGRLSWGPPRGTVRRDRGHGVQHLVHPRGYHRRDRTACRLPALAGSLVGGAGPEVTPPDGVHPFREPPRPIRASRPASPPRCPAAAPAKGL